MSAPQPYVTPLASIVVPSSWVDLGGGRRLSVRPLMSDDGQAFYARPTQDDAEAVLWDRGLFLPQQSDIERLVELARANGTYIEPVILPTQAMAGPMRPGESEHDYNVRIRVPMRSVEWCRIHDAEVSKRSAGPKATAVGAPLACIGKHPIAPHAAGRIRLFGWFSEKENRWWQTPGVFEGQHESTYTDYATLYLALSADRPTDDDLHVATRRTTATALEVYEALASALAAAGVADVSVAATLLLTQYSFETGDGAHCYNWNLGNVRRRPGQLFCTLQNVSERVGPDGHIQTYTSGPGTHFSAFPGLRSAASAWVSFLYARYSKAFAVLQNARIASPAALDAYCAELKAGHYYTATLAEYSAGCRAAMARLGQQIYAGKVLRALNYSSVKAFQSAHPPLVADGILGPRTLKALEAEAERLGLVV